MVRRAASAASPSAKSSHFDPLRVRPERRRPADWSLPGHCPAQHASCLAVGNTDISAPISAMMYSAVRRRSPGIVHSSQRPSRRGDLLPDRVGKTADLLIQEVDMREDRTDQTACRRSKRPSKDSLSAGSFARSLPFARSASTSGSVAGAADQRVEHPTAEDTENVGGDTVELDTGVLERLMQPVGLPERSSIWVLRYRVRFRNARIGFGGTKLARVGRPPRADKSIRRP